LDKRYHRRRFTWWTNVDLEQIQQRLKDKYDVEYKKIPWDDERSISLFKDLNDRLIVKADTLRAFLTADSVTIFQREEGNMTEKDQELRKDLLKIYPYDRPTPLHLR
jgi:hypothetical protein